MRGIYARRRRFHLGSPPTAAGLLGARAWNIVSASPYPGVSGVAYPIIYVASVLSVSDRATPRSGRELELPVGS